jgi:hypothetical protein
LGINELLIRESVRDLVPRHNRFGDAGRETTSRSSSLSTRAPRSATDRDQDWARSGGDQEPSRSHPSELAARAWRERSSARRRGAYVRHGVTTHVIGILGENHAGGTSYVTALRDSGLTSWGRYFDEYVRISKSWLFSSRRALSDTVPQQVRWCAMREGCCP